jgi:pilus assembly protein CpaC
MKIVIKVCIFLAVFAAGLDCRAQQPQQTQVQASSDASAARAGAAQGAAAPPQQEVQPVPLASAAPLRVMVGKSLLINTQERLKRVSVTDPAVADAVAVSPNQVVIHGRSAGEVTLILWDEQERSRSFDLRVDVDTTAAAQEIKHLFPDQVIEVSASRSALVLSGHVGTKEDAERAGLVAGAYSKNIVNALTFGPVGVQAVLLEVKFAEVDRTALTQVGFNLFSTGAANTFGAISTQQFGGLAGSNIGAVTSDVSQGTIPQTAHLATSEIGNQLFHQPATFGSNDLLNIFLFRTDVNLGLIIKALQQKNILQILAEPNLIAVNGKEASFLAGGEFPFPVVQQGVGGNSVTIIFKEFGVRLRFTPLILPNGDIYLTVKPEVSSLDFSNALTISGFVIPALSTRRAETEFVVKDGQSFVIAGLMDNRVTSVINKVPGLGDIPILGQFFRSKNLQKSNSELMVLVTARRVSPTTTPPPFPKNPKEFMNPEKFDGGKPGGTGK